MWFSFWRSRDRYSLDELRFLIDQLTKVQNVNEANKDFVIEALRSIAELITYGDQHDNSYFEFFMEKQVLGEIVRILKVSRTLIVSLQILQSMSIMIQNLENEHSIYYIFSNEHANYLITYSFDFRNEELLSYYISFLRRAIGGKLNRDTISLLLKTENDEIVSFPLYIEAIRFAFHEESMIRTAVRALTLNVYHVGDDAVNRFVARAPQAEYFLNLVNFFRDQCVHLNQIVSDASKDQGIDATSSISTVVDEIEDNLYYFSDVISAGIPEVGQLIMENILRLLIFPLILPSLMIEPREAYTHELGLADICSLYLLCCILRIVKIKDLANIVAAALLCPLPSCPKKSDAKPNGILLAQCPDAKTQSTDDKNGTSSSHVFLQDRFKNCDSTPFTPRDALLSFITTGNDVQVSGSLCVLVTLLQTKELDESMVDAVGILPQRKQHKKKLLQALVGEDSGDEQLFSSRATKVESSFTTELDTYLQKLKNYGGVSCQSIGANMNPRMHRYQVLGALVDLFCRSNISAETLWDGGWLLRQLLPYSEAEYSRNHLRLLKESFINSTICVLEETRGTWPDLLKTVICDEWIKCKRAMEASSPRKDPKCILMPSHKPVITERSLLESSFSAGQRTCETVKVVFVLLHYLQSFLLGNVLPEQPPLVTEVDTPENSRAKSVGIKAATLKTNTEINLVDAVPCRIAFERGRERHFYLLALSVGCAGWLVLLDDFPLKPHHGVIRVLAPLAGCNPRIDGKNSRWLHLRIRPSSFPFTNTSNYTAHGKLKSKALVDGRWTLAFRDEESCKYALNMILEEINLQSRAVERTIQPLLDID
ncbi:hypothetical protein M569_04875, partial [Genlisea aurea]